MNILLLVVHLAYSVVDQMDNLCLYPVLSSELIQVRYLYKTRKFARVSYWQIFLSTLGSATDHKEDRIMLDTVMQFPLYKSCDLLYRRIPKGYRTEHY